ncbi:MAG: zinc-binding dehydrogenase [Candidatus Methanodesulfokora washburnensis]|jgi:acryloyl-coenzyme A reductase
MKAVVLEGIGRASLKDVELPEPKPGEVVIKQGITGVCYRDILTVEGFFPRVRVPVILGHEIAGEVWESRSERFRKGDIVASLTYIPCGSCDRCRKGEENICRNRIAYGEDVDGSYAEYVRVDERSLVKVPNGTPMEGAVIAACVTGMIIHAFEIAGLKEGEKVLITGAGGIGVHAVQIAKAYGAEVIAETSSEWKKDRLFSLGADHVVCSKEFSSDVRKIAKEGVDLVLEGVGQPTIDQSLKSVRWGGRIVVVGNVNVKPVELNLGSIILREVRIFGSIGATRADLEKALKLTSEGKIKPVIHSVLPVEEFQRAHEMMKRRENFGRILLKF